MDLEKFIRTVPDFPIKGINFYDITTLFDNKITFNYIIQILSNRYKSKGLDKIVAIEARGFILGSALAHSLDLGFVPIRKKGKLPYKTISNTYSLEYGEDTIEIHVDAINKNEKVLLVDDLIATGGTAQASADLVKQLNGQLYECCFIIDLPELGGSKKLLDDGHNVYSILSLEEK
jgi:adenine phosphoribosyltransferase